MSTQVGARPLPPRPLPPRSRAAGADASLHLVPPRPLSDRPAAKARPDPSSLRLAIAFTGLAAASAMATAFLAPVSGAAAQTTTRVVAVAPPPIQHVTRYVQLQPGQTAPPQSTVQQAPAPSPRIVTVTTRQSGKKP